MKKLLIAAALTSMIACSKKTVTTISDEEYVPLSTTPQQTEISKCLVLKVDFSGYNFEAGTELSFSSPKTIGDSIPVKIDFKAPATTGDLKLFFAPTNDTLFGGGIASMAPSKMYFPRKLEPEVNYGRLASAPPRPPFDRFQQIKAQGLSNAQPDLDKLWNTIGRIQAVDAYLQARKKMVIALYTPSVNGSGFDGSQARWMVFLFK